MAKNKHNTMRVVRWRGGQHPTISLMKQNLEHHGLRVFRWSQRPNYRFGLRSHGYAKSLYCVEGSIEVFLPDIRQRETLRPGDRIDLASGVRHSITVGLTGATCLEGTPANHRLVAAGDCLCLYAVPIGLKARLFSAPGSVDKFVPDTGHGKQQARNTGVKLDFFSQTTHIDGDHLFGIRRTVISPHCVKNLAPAKNLIRVLGKKRQQS